MTERQREFYDKVKNASGNLILGDHQTGDEEAKAIAEALKVNKTVTWLILWATQIGHVGAQAIAEALKVNRTLKELHLHTNQIGDAGAQAIFEALKENATVTKLGLSDSQIGDAGAHAIAEALKVNKTLSCLKLCACQIGDAGAHAIAEALRVNKTVTTLYLHENQIGDAGARAIAEALRVNTTLTQLYLHMNQIGDVGAQAIAEALKLNTMVNELFLSGNQIGDIGVHAIAEALKVNTTVTELDLRYNCIGNVGLQAFDEMCQVNRTLHRTLSNFWIDGQINPLAFSLLPRLATAEDLHNVFHLLSSGLALEDQPTSLPALPNEIAELIMDKAHYWQGVQHTKRSEFHDEFPAYLILKVTLPQCVNGNSIRIKAIQVLRDWRTRIDSKVGSRFDLIVRDEQGALRYECSEKSTVVDSNLDLVTILPANDPIIRQMRAGWQVQVRTSKSSRDELFESLYVGFV